MDDHPRLKVARDLIKAKDFDAARALLENMPDDPQAQAWLEYLDIAAPEEAQKRKNDDRHIAEDDNYYYPGKRKPKNDDRAEVETDDYYYPGQRKLKNDELDADKPKDYLSSALLTLGLYWVVPPAGLFANVYYLVEARRLQREQGIQTENVGCLWTMLAFTAVGVICAIVAAVIIFATAWTFVE